MVKKIYAQVPTNATGLDIKQKIRDKKGIPIHHQELSYGTQVVDDSRLLSYYGVQNATILTLKVYITNGDCSECSRMKQKVTITVKSLSKSINVDCTLGEPVENLKNSIRMMEGIPVSRQMLVCKNETLENHKLLATYKFLDEESGETDQPVVQLLISYGTPTLVEKLRSMVSFKGWLS